MAKMSLVHVLQDFKKFMEEQVAPSLSLLKEQTEDEFVNPYVGLITLPHKNFMPVNFQVPHILIGVEKGVNDMDKSHDVDLRIQCAAYGGDYQFQEVANLPDEKGYFDLLTMQERIIHELVQTVVIGNCTVDTNFEYGIYDEEVTYPYWYGYIKFKISLPIINRQIEDFL